MIIKLSPELAKKGTNIPSHIASGFTSAFVSYLIDPEYRKGTELKKWLREQLREPSEALVAEAGKIPSSEDPDEQIIHVLKHVNKTITYVTDSKQWGFPEKWSLAEETLTNKKGDCEDGAILIYVLARMKGVPADRIYLFAGDVEGGGHAWIGYRPTLYPLNWSFIDWCYWYKGSGIERRPLFYVKSKDIQGYEHLDGRVTGDYSKYKRLWFLVNENDAHRSLFYKQ